MKLNSILPALLFCFFFSTNCLAQWDAKLAVKADERVEEINHDIVSINSELGLTDEQKRSIRLLYIRRTDVIRQAKLSGATEEEKEKVVEAAILYFNDEVNHVVLTQEQFKAKRQGAKLRHEALLDEAGKN